MNALPFQRITVPIDPTSHTSPGCVTHNALHTTPTGPATGTCDQPVGVRCITAPCESSAHTSIKLPPATDTNCRCGAVVSGVQVAPSECRIRPPSPTAQTSPGPLPHTARSASGGVIATGDHCMPFHCSIPWLPTA